MPETASQEEIMTSETRTTPLEKVQSSDFPADLKVLLVDEDVACLKSVVAMLEECSYKVTATTKADEALEILRSRKDDQYDIVITDVTMPGIDGFQLLKIISLEMDIPVIMISANSERDTVMKGIDHGARVCLVKPIRLLELKNIWQHVIRKINSNHSKPALPKDEAMTTLLPIEKQRDLSPEKEEDEINTPSKEGKLSRKRPRFKWTKELHGKFVDVVHRLGIDVPKKIIEIMKEPMLTREIIASHLQRYRETSKKKQASTSQVRNGVYAYRRHGDHLPNTISSYNHGHNLIAKSETSTSSLTNPNQRPVLSSFYHPGMSPQQYILPPLMPNHIRPSEPVLAWLDYCKGSSQIPNTNPPNQYGSSHFASLSPAVQHDPNNYLGMVALLAGENNTSGIHPYPFPPQRSSFNLGAGPPLCVLRDGSSQTFQIRQPNPWNETINQSSLPENNGHYAYGSFADDELMTLLQQFVSTSSPEL